MLALGSILLSVACSQLDGGVAPPNAHALWSAPDPALERLHEASELPWDFDRQMVVAEEELDQAKALLPVLDAAVSRLREGLGAATCRWSSDGSFIQPVSLARAARARAVVAAASGEPPSAIAMELLQVGRKLARCDGAP